MSVPISMFCICWCECTYACVFTRGCTFDPVSVCVGVFPRCMSLEFKSDGEHNLTRLISATKKANSSPRRNATVKERKSVRIALPLFNTAYSR